MYEGGIRTFGLVRWPGHVAAGRVDETSVIGGVDWLPTICKLAGVAVPESVQPDGEDVSDIWLGQSRPRRKPLALGVALPRLGRRVSAADAGDPRRRMETVRQPRRQPRRACTTFPRTAPSNTTWPQRIRTSCENSRPKALAWQKISSAEPGPRSRRPRADKPIDAPRKPAQAKPGAAKKPALDRAAIFKVKDTNHDGKLSLEEYLYRFPDQAEGRRRFPTFDTNKDGVLSEEEFVNMGRRR